MKSLVALMAVVAAFALLFPRDAQGGALTEEEANRIAANAYVYGYPLVTMEMTRRIMTNVVKPDGRGHAPMGQFAHLREFPNASYHEFTTPNVDTLYSLGWVDVGREPYILHVPDENGRYYLMPVLDAWTEVISTPGSRTTGTGAGNFAILGPKWKGELPAGVQRIQSPTDLVWILGRTYTTGTPGDYKLARAIQDQYRLTPLSHYGRPYAPPPGKVNPSVDMKTPTRDQVDRLGGLAFFQMLASLMEHNPPAPEDATMVADMEKLGIVAGKRLDPAELTAVARLAIQMAPNNGRERVTQQRRAGAKVNGWEVSLLTGSYGTEYAQRALVAAIGLGANLPEDAMYPLATVDGDGKPLSGANRYILHFKAGELPPVYGFWSLTMYGPDYFFVPNRLNRFNLSSRDSFRHNANGSLDLYLQKDSPGAEWEANWLPAPLGDFAVVLRLYWPGRNILTGEWQPPAIKKLP